MNIEQARFNMIEQQIRPWDVLDPGVLTLLAVVKREDFVPAAYRSLAFVDTEVPLPQGQCMLAPKVEARLLQELGLHKHERVLEIGTGSGYMAALLAHKAQHVTTLEIRPELALMAKINLQRAAVLNATIREADGSHGLAAEGPYDAIVLSGSVAQIKVGGRLIAVVGQLPIMRAVLVTRDSEHGFRSADLFDTVASRLQGFDEPTRFKF
jgi:protein-L-isoaspartate(D-aspartate) O-methyltransferase